MAQDVEAELADVQRERNDMEERIDLRYEETNGKDEDMTETQVASEEPPSPRTLSPVTFAEILDAVKGGAFLKTEIEMIVAKLVPLWPESGVDGLAEDDLGGYRMGTDCRMNREEMKIGTRPVLVGTDARGFWLPPDRSCLVSMMKNGSVAGTDPLGFRYLPDRLLFRLKMLLCGRREENVPPGTDERCFQWAPDWMGRELRKITGEVSVSLSENKYAAGIRTDEQ